MKIRARYLHALESMTNVVVGYAINLVLVYSILHFLGFNIALKDNATMGVIVALVSFMRGYIIRRIFNDVVRKAYE
tara:strand:- start:177 stop:404 length:228 start_codon:yes stop_codon:yes gene_type:complete